MSALRNDPPRLSITGLSMGRSFQRYSPWQRLQQEISYGRRLSKRLRESKPDVFLTCNTPLVSLYVVSRACAHQETPVVFWQQDVNSAAIRAAARDRLGVVGWPIGTIAELVERHIARAARIIVPISPAFLPTLRAWSVEDRAVVIPNWAPLPELPTRPRGNLWARRHDLIGRGVVLYSGTLGVKHDPRILLDLARSMRTAFPTGRVVVISEGMGREWLEQRKTTEGLDNLLLLDYQPYDELPDVMAAADILIAILEPSAGRYSVPSKVLSYLCSGRTIVALLPGDNAAAATIRESGGGVALEPDQREEAIAIVLRFLGDQTVRERMGSSARRYAETAFDIDKIGGEFEAILLKAIGG
jgi:colanic acid biosynthesis glycosyl transferase WcaI